MTATLEPPTTSPDGSPRRRFWTWPRALGIGVFVLFAAMWVYLFGFTGDYHQAGYLKDRAFPVAAEKICAASMTRLDALPPAHNAKSTTARADTIEQADVILRDMQRQLRAVVPANGDKKYIDQWIDDYSILIGDREDYARRIRTDPGADYLVTKKYGAQISEALDNYATVNNMPKCVTPGDV